MKEYLENRNGKSYSHYVSPIQADYALCGQDLSGDEDLGWKQGKKTNMPVNCPDCLNIVKYCISL